ncbi:hypothetical protein KI688_008845 [Linnemannia hyalina]|uniref:Uncharacterized protein n=1 Tax=Linnemannia hyalina TaxID=64524 RepID=A0A9P7XHR0_9FUNG|nr:hypothetical protein KI688_008845 [Linnemannia hyalina]
MVTGTHKAVRVAAIALSTISFLLLLNTLFRHSSNNPHPTKLRVEEPVVVILVHPSPTLNRAENFELKRAIARTWAKDAEDFGASIFFVGEHDGETVMRRPGEFQGRAQSLSMRFVDPTDGAEEGTSGGSGNGGRGVSTSGGASGAGGSGGAGDEYSKQEPMRKMLIPSILENGQADSASGLLKAYHFLYNNTNWYAGPMLHTYPFILTTDTTHYIHVENLVTALLSSRPRRLLTMKDDHSFTGSFSEASECSAEDFGDKVPPVVVDYQSSTAAKKTASLQHTHWTLSGTHLVSRQLVALVGPHLHQCVLNNGSTSSSPVNGDSLEGGEAFQECVQQWASHPLFWKNGYCGRLAALRYDASALNSPGSYSSYPLSTSLSSSQGSILSSNTRSTYEAFGRKDRRGLLPLSPSPENFESFYQMKQRERAQVQDRRVESYDEEEDDSMNRDDENDDSAIDVGNDDQNTMSSDERNGNTVVRAATSSENTAGSTTHWIVGSGLTRPEDFTLLYQALIDHEADAQPDYNEFDDE